MTRPEDYEATDNPHCFTITMGEQSYGLTWHNTTVRKFKVGDGEYDYVLHQLEDGSFLYFFLNDKNATGIREFLEENDYPYRMDPALDQETIELYTRTQLSRLDDEIIKS